MEPTINRQNGRNENGNKYEMVTSIAAFHGIESEDEISFEKGELIAIHRREANRCFGERLIGKQRGWFSASAVKPIRGKVGSIASTFGSVVTTTTTTTRIFVDQNQKLKNWNIETNEEEEEEGKEDEDKKVEMKKDKNETVEVVRAELNDKKAAVSIETIKFESTTTKMTQSSYLYQQLQQQQQDRQSKVTTNDDIEFISNNFVRCNDSRFNHNSLSPSPPPSSSSSSSELGRLFQMANKKQHQSQQQQVPSEQSQVGRTQLRRQPSRPPIDSIESTTESVTTYSSSSSSDRNSASSYDTIWSTTSTDETDETSGISSANFVVAIARFDGTESKHLSLAVGDIVRVNDLECEWYEGERIVLRNSPNDRDGDNEPLSASGSGWFPAANVKTLAKEYLNFDHTGKRIGIGGDAKSSRSPNESRRKSGRTGKWSEIFDTSKRKLLKKMSKTLQQQQMLRRHSSHEPAESDRVDYGLIEDLRLAKISSQMSSPKNLSPRPFFHPPKTPQSESPPTSPPPSPPPPPSPKPIDPIVQRAKIIDEMLSSEQKFVKDLTFVFEKFPESISESPSSASIEVDFSLFFDHLRLIKDMHERFCENLQERLESDGDENGQTTTTATEIGDLLCEHFATISPIYQRFCGANTAKLLSRIDADTTLVGALTTLIAENNLAKLSCDAYLLLPLRHLISYPVKIENLLPNISPAERDYARCVEARDAARRFCEATNHAYDKTCREWEPFQRLAWIQSHVTIPAGAMDQTIQFDSITQFVGPRELLHAGLLYKDSKLLLVLLFNDMLLFAAPTDREQEREIEREAAGNANTAFGVSQVLKRPAIRRHAFKLYHEPLRLDEFRIGDLRQFESSLYSQYIFRLEAETERPKGGVIGGAAKVARPIALRAASLDDMARWVKQITIAQNEHKRAKKETLESESAATTPSVDSAEMPLLAIMSLSSIDAVQLCTTNHALLAYCKLAIGRRWTEAHTFSTTEIVRSDRPTETTSDGVWRTFSTITFGIERQLCVHDTGDILFVRCFEANRFAPPRFIGEATLPIGQLIAQSQHLKKFTKGAPLRFADESLAKTLSALHQINPCLLIKFDLL